MTSEINITISGATGVGKTTTLQLIVAALRGVGLNVIVDYGPDGDPQRTPDRAYRCLTSLIERKPTIHVREAITRCNAWKGRFK